MYDNGNDAAFFMSADVINTIAVDKITRETEFEAILGCQDNRIRVVQGSSLGFEIRTVAPVTCVGTIQGDESRRRKGGVGVIYGMENGGLTLVEAGSVGTNLQWALDDGVRKSKINCIRVFDVTRDGQFEIIVGRDDGRVEIYAADKLAKGVPHKIFSRDIGIWRSFNACGVSVVY